MEGLDSQFDQCVGPTDQLHHDQPRQTAAIMAHDASGPKRSNPTDLVSSLDVKVLGVDLFLSTDVRLPRGERGVYGGQVVSQAIMAATRTVDQTFHLHSLHCYFVSNGLLAPIHYHVDRIRNGRSYSTRAVRAVQDSKPIFVMMCSFQKPEPWQPIFRSLMPKLPAPEECATFQEYYRKRAEEETENWTKRRHIAKAKFHDNIPIEARRAADGLHDGYYIWCIWTRVIHLPECNPAYQKAILGYVSDLLFLEAANIALGLRESDGEGADVSALSTTMDHSIWYYSDDFDCSQWLMLESRVSQAGSGRAITHRRAFTHDGTLIAHFSQEGVVRARVYGPEKLGEKESKL